MTWQQYFRQELGIHAAMRSDEGQASTEDFVEHLPADLAALLEKTFGTPFQLECGAGKLAADEVPLSVLRRTITGRAMGL